MNLIMAKENRRRWQETKINSKPTPFLSLFQARLHSFTPDSSTHSPSSAARDGCLCVQSIHNRASPSLSPFSCAPVWVLPWAAVVKTIQNPTQNPPKLLWCEISSGRGSDLCSSVGSPRDRREACPGTWSTSSSPLLTLVFTLLFLTTRPAPLPFLNRWLQMCHTSAVSCGWDQLLKLGGISSVLHRAASASSPRIPPVTKTLALTRDAWTCLSATRTIMLLKPDQGLYLCYMP